MLLCDWCQQEYRNRGMKMITVYEAYTFKESMEKNIPCECCDEYDYLYECVIYDKKGDN